MQWGSGSLFCVFSGQHSAGKDGFAVGLRGAFQLLGEQPGELGGILVAYRFGYVLDAQRGLGKQCLGFFQFLELDISGRGDSGDFLEEFGEIVGTEAHLAGDFGDGQLVVQVLADVPDGGTDSHVRGITCLEGSKAFFGDELDEEQ